MSEEYAYEQEEDAELSGLNIINIPPRGHFHWLRTEWTYTHQQVYVVQVAALGIADNRRAFLRTVIMAVIKDAQSDEIDFNGLVVEALENYYGTD